MGPLFSEAKRWHGLGCLRLRGLERVNTEALLVAAGQNVKRLLAFGSWGPKEQSQVAVMRPPVLANRKLHRFRRQRPWYHDARRSPFCNTFRGYLARYAQGTRFGGGGVAPVASGGNRGPRKRWEPREIVSRRVFLPYHLPDNVDERAVSVLDHRHDLVARLCGSRCAGGLVGRPFQIGDVPHG